MSISSAEPSAKVSSAPHRKFFPAASRAENSANVDTPAFHFVNITWGANHTGLFLDVALPSQLSPGNLPALVNCPKSVYKIYTTEDDAKVIRAHPAFQKLQALMTAEIIPIDTALSDRPHDVLTHYHKHSIRAAAAVGSTVVFLAPDIVVGDGSYRNMARMMREGKKAVLVAGLRLEKETFVPALARHRKKSTVEFGISPRELVDLAMQNLHPTSQSLQWPPRTCWPSHLYWAVNSSGLVARCFHLHPLYVVTTPEEVEFSSTIDGDYVLNACKNPNDVHIVDDSDELLICEISPRDYTVGVTDVALDEHAVAKWGVSYANTLHQKLVRSAIRFHGTETSPTWSEIEESAERVVKRIIRLLPWYRLRLAVIRVLITVARKLRLRGIARRTKSIFRRLASLVQKRTED